jgi:hypothetical protein
MSFKHKCQILITLFCVESLIHLFDGAAAFFNGTAFGQFGNGFATAAIFAFLAYAIYALRSRTTYWMAVFFAALILVRFVLGTCLTIFSGTTLPMNILILGTVNSVLFGIIPLVILLPQAFRSQFIDQQNPLSP